MTLDTVQKDIATLLANSDGLGLQLYFVFKTSDKFEVYEPALDNEELEPALKKDFLSEIRMQFMVPKEEENLELISLNTAEATDRKTIYHIKSSEIPQAKKLFSVVKLESDIPKYNPSEHELTQVWGLVIKIAESSQTIYLFKRNYSVNVIKSGKTYPLFFNQGALQLEKKELLKVSAKFEFMYLKDSLLILNKDEFETSFDYIYAVEEKANSAIDVILASKIIADGSRLYNLSKQRNHVKKIISIKADNPVFKKTAKQIASFAKKYGYIISLSDDKTRLELKNQKEAKSLLKLFNDDLLLSELSNTKYDSRGKHKIDI